MALSARVPEPGFYYNHKHDSRGPVNDHAYEVIGLGFHTEKEEDSDEKHFVIYRPLYEAFVFKTSRELGVPCFDVRPLEMWTEDVMKDNVAVPRFQKITDTSVIAQLMEIRNKMYP